MGVFTHAMVLKLHHNIILKDKTFQIVPGTSNLWLVCVL